MHTVTRPYELLYDAVACSMFAYARTAFRVQVLDAAPVRYPRHTMFVVTHRAETDVPLLCAHFYTHWRLWRIRQPRIHFAARDDLFEQGFFAGFPPGVPLPLRRALYGIDVGGWLPRVRVHPVRPPGTMMLGQALRQLAPGTPLAEVLPGALVERFAARAAETGRRPPRAIGDVLAGTYADLLWLPQTPESLPGPTFEAAWRTRAADAASDIRWLIDIVQAGEPLLLFPEGRPSPDGEIGPVRKGAGILIRRGRPEVLQPVGVAYDPLTTGRPHALIGILPHEPPPPASLVDETVLGLLRRSVPLSGGQVVATALLDAARADEAEVRPRSLLDAVRDAVPVAAAAGRPIAAELADPGRRIGRLDAAIRCLLERGVLHRAGRARLRLDAEAALADPVLDRLAREDASARAVGPPCQTSS